MSQCIDCGPRQLFFQCGTEMSKVWTHLAHRIVVATFSLPGIHLEEGVKKKCKEGCLVAFGRMFLSLLKRHHKNRPFMPLGWLLLDAVPGTAGVSWSQGTSSGVKPVLRTAGGRQEPGDTSELRDGLNLKPLHHCHW